MAPLGPQARGQVLRLGGQNTCLGGKIFTSIIQVRLNKLFWGTKKFESTAPVCPPLLSPYVSPMATSLRPPIYNILHVTHNIYISKNIDLF